PGVARIAGTGGGPRLLGPSLFAGPLPRCRPRGVDGAVRGVEAACRAAVNQTRPDFVLASCFVIQHPCQVDASDFPSSNLSARSTVYFVLFHFHNLTDKAQRSEAHGGDL